MIGAIIGDVAGSRFERRPVKTTDFELFGGRCRFTDDTVMTLAVARAVLESRGRPDRLRAAAEASMRELGRAHPRAGYGGGFKRWLASEDPRPYGSWGNGSAMRVSACGWAAGSLQEALDMARAVTLPTHDHPEGLKGAASVAAGIRLALEGASLDEIRAHLQENYYDLGFTLDSIRADYRFSSSCRGSVPQAIVAFLESSSLERAVRLAVSLGGDSDTQAAIAGSLAEAKFGAPDDLRAGAEAFLSGDLKAVLRDFEALYPPPEAPPSGAPGA